MKNVLLVANWKSDVGYAWWLMENFWAEIAKLCDERGWGCHIAYPKITTISPTMMNAPVSIHQLDYSRRSIFFLLAFVRTHNIKFIYLTDRAFFSLKYGILRVFGVRRIVVHDHTPGERSVPHGLKQKMKVLKNRLPWLTADAYIAVSSFVKNRHIQSGCTPDYKSYLVTNGITPIGRDPSLNEYCNKEFQIPTKAVVVFTSGRASPYKQIDFIIRCAARLIHESRYNVFFLYCGDGPDLERLVELARSLSLQERFIFVGKRSDVRHIVQSCHIGMHASKGEVGFSLSILEYMSAGLATVLPDNPSVCQSVLDGHSGLLYRADDVTSACQALGSLIVDKALRERLGNTAMQTVREQYNLVDTNARLRSVIAEILEPRTLASVVEKA